MSVETDKGFQTPKPLPKVAAKSKILWFYENWIQQMRIRVLDDIWSYIPKACNFPELPGNALAKISGMAYPKITLGLVCAFQSGNVL